MRSPPRPREEQRILALVVQSIAPAVRQLQESSTLERVWKYVALGGTSIVFEEANPILGGIAVRHGRADLLAVVIAVALGTWAASLALYLVGRWKITWVRERFPAQRRLLVGALLIVRRHPLRASLAVRFAYGLRLPLPIACGAARVPWSVYAIGSGISCWIWGAAFALLGFAASGVALRALNFTHRADVRLGLLVALLIMVLFVITRRRRIAERTTRVLAGEDVPLVTMAE